MHYGLHLVFDQRSLVRLNLDELERRLRPDLLKAVIADVKSFCDTVSTHTTPGYGAPSVQLNQAASALKSAMESRESEIPNLKSKRIFGE